MNKQLMKKFAKITVEIGANVKKGQQVIIVASTNQSEFVVALTEACYKRKAKSVSVDWANDDVTKLNYLNMSQETLDELQDWKVEKLKYNAKVLPCMIYIDDSPANYFKDVDMTKVTNARIKQYPIIKPIRDSMENKYQWVIVAMPSLAWAKEIFPNEKDRIAYKKLEEAILYTTRVTTTSNPVKAWKTHLKALQDKAKILNDFNFDYLTFQSSNGTNLKIGLQKNHYWLSAGEKTLGKKVDFVANMPTEEVFTMPRRDDVEGLVVSTKPLSYRGQLIEEFKVWFSKGKVEKIEAKTGQEVLQNMLDMDEGSKHLGEVALVPYDSPISQSGILFYNTLFDENASCHLAFGSAYKNTLKDYEKLQEDDWEKINFNDSMNHVDFMIGSKDTLITGTTYDGKKIVIFKDGNWAI